MYFFVNFNFYSNMEIFLTEKEYVFLWENDIPPHQS